MLDQLYTQPLLVLAAHIPHLGRLDHPDASASAQARLCGSSITVDLKLQEDRVIDYAQEVKACALGQATASVMGKHIIGSTARELMDLRLTMHDMLKKEGPPPEGKWQELSLFEALREYKPRHASMLLVFDAVVKALDSVALQPGKA